jgi:hypothetical protein
VYLKFSLALGGLILGVGCGSSEQGGATDKAGPTPEDILKEQKAIAEYYMISYKGKFVADKKPAKSSSCYFLPRLLPTLVSIELPSLRI